MTFSVIHLCGPRIYEFDGVGFEFGYSTGPWPLKKDGDPRARAGRGFYKRIGPWLKMADPQREVYRVGGGCQCFTAGKGTLGGMGV